MKAYIALFYLGFLPMSVFAVEPLIDFIPPDNQVDRIINKEVTDNEKIGTEDDIFNMVLKNLNKLSPEQIKIIRSLDLERKKAQDLPVNSIEINTKTHNVTPGMTVKPITINISSGFVNAVTIIDINGSQWPIDKVHYIKGKGLNINESDAQKNLFTMNLDDSRPFIITGIQLDIAGLSSTIPLIIRSNNNETDISTTLRIAGVSPDAKSEISSIMNESSTLSEQDDELTRLLSGLKPNEKAKVLTLKSDDDINHIVAFDYNDAYWVRLPVSVDLILPAYTNAFTSSGFRAYKIQRIESMTVFSGNKTINIQIER